MIDVGTLISWVLMQWLAFDGRWQYTQTMRGISHSTGHTCVIMSGGTPMHAFLRVATPAGSILTQGLANGPRSPHHRKALTLRHDGLQHSGRRGETRARANAWCLLMLAEERERNAFACIERHQAFALAPVLAEASLPVLCF